MYCFFYRKFLRNNRRKCTCKKALDRLPCFSKSSPEKLRLQCCSHNSPCRQWSFVCSCAQTCVRSMIAFPAFTLRKTAKDQKVFFTGGIFFSTVSARHVSKRSRDILFIDFLMSKSKRYFFLRMRNGKYFSGVACHLV